MGTERREKRVVFMARMMLGRPRLTPHLAPGLHFLTMCAASSPAPMSDGSLPALPTEQELAAYTCAINAKDSVPHPQLARCRRQQLGLYAAHFQLFKDRTSTSMIGNFLALAGNPGLVTPSFMHV